METWHEAKSDFEAAISASSSAVCPVCEGKKTTPVGRGFNKTSVPCVACEYTGKKWPTS